MNGPIRPSAGSSSSASSGRCCSSSPRRAPRSRSSRSACGGAGRTRPSMVSIFFAALRVLRRDRVPAALVPGRRGLLADQLRPGGPAAHGRPDRQLDRLRPDRVPDRPLQVAASSARSPSWASAILLMTQLTKDTPVPIVWLWMFIAGLGVGPTFSVLHDRHPERRAVPAARRRDLEPDVLPPDRRHDRAGLRRDDLRHDVQGATWCRRWSAAGVPPQVIDGFTAGELRAERSTSAS